MRLTSAERVLLQELLVRLTDAARLVEDSVVIIRLGKKPAAKKSETFAAPLQEANESLRQSLLLIGRLMNDTDHTKSTMEIFSMESMSMDTVHARALSQELIEACMGPITVLDDIIAAIDDPPVPPEEKTEREQFEKIKKRFGG